MNRFTTGKKKRTDIKFKLEFRVFLEIRSGLVWSGLVWSGLVWSGLVKNWSGINFVYDHVNSKNFFESIFKITTNLI